MMMITDQLLMGCASLISLWYFSRCFTRYLCILYSFL